MSSLSLKRLTLRNFMSFGNNVSEIDLSGKGTTLILGENLDTGGHNGVGKSTIINAISYALYNKVLSNVSKERLINRTNSSKNTSMEVTLEFEKDGDTYEINRSRGESYAIKIIKNYDGENPITPDSVSNADKLIAEIIGISYEMFRRTVVFIGSDQSFFEMPLSHQRGLIEELFKITLLSEKAVLLKEIIVDTNKNIEIQKVLIDSQIKAADLKQKHISDAKDRTVRWEMDRQKKITTIGDQLESIKDIDFDAEQALHQELNDKEKLFDSNFIPLAAATSDETRQSNKLKKLNSEIEQLSASTCPYCHQEYADCEEKMLEKKAEAEQHQIKLDEAVAEINERTPISEQLREEAADIRAKIQYPNINKLIETKANSDNLANSLVELEKADNPHVEAYESLLSEKEVEIDHAALDTLKLDLDHQKFLLKLLSDKNSFIRKKIINKTIPFLNRQLQEYTYDLGLPHIVKFTPDMKCNISEHGRELDYGNLSGGEKKRVNLSLSLAFRDVLQHLHSSINILVCDEVDGGSVDPLGIEAMIKIFKLKSREQDLGVWVISHRPEMIGRFDNEITIRKENGFSSFDEL